MDDDVAVQRHRRVAEALGDAAIDTAPMPSASASSIAAAWTMPAAVIAGRGPRRRRLGQTPADREARAAAQVPSFDILSRSIELCRTYTISMTYTETITEPTATWQRRSRCRGCTKRFGDRAVLDGLDLTVAPGRGLRPARPERRRQVDVHPHPHHADAGRRRRRRASPATTSPPIPMAVRRAISVTGQATAVDELLTGRENLRDDRPHRRAAPARRPPPGRRAARPVRPRSTPPTSRAGSYSGGMRRRLDLAASLVVVPAVLFLDEPTTGLDTRSRQTLWRRIEELAASGITILLTTQYLEEADELADRIGVLDGGRLVAEGTAAELKARVGSEVLVLDIADPTTARGGARGRRRHGRPARADPRPHGRLGRPHPPACSTTLAAHGLDDVRVAVHAPTLDDVFIALTEVVAMTGTFTVEAEFVRRGMRHTLRNPDALVTSLALPVIILLLFVYVFGGAISTARRVHRLRRARDRRAVRDVRRGGHGGRRLHRQGQRRHGPLPHDADPRRRGAGRARRRQPAAQPRRRRRSSSAWRSPSASDPTPTPLEWLAATGVIVLVVLAITWLATAAGLLAGTVESANALGLHGDVPAVPQLERLRRRRRHCRRGCRAIARHQPVTPVIETLRGPAHRDTDRQRGLVGAAVVGRLLVVSAMAAASKLFRRAGRPTEQTAVHGHRRPQPPDQRRPGHLPGPAGPDDQRPPLARALAGALRAGLRVPDRAHRHGVQHRARTSTRRSTGSPTATTSPGSTSTASSASPGVLVDADGGAGGRRCAARRRRRRRPGRAVPHRLGPPLGHRRLRRRGATRSSAWTPSSALVAGGAAVVGIDSVNIDDTRTGERPVHTALLGAGIPIVEHLRGLDAAARHDVHVHGRAAGRRRDGDVPGAGAGADRRLSQPIAGGQRGGRRR